MTNYPQGRGVPLLGSQAIPAGLSIVGVAAGDMVGALQLQDVYFMVALHALLSRESTRTSARAIAQTAREVAAEAMIARAPEAAKAEEPPAAPQAG